MARIPERSLRVSRVRVFVEDAHRGRHQVVELTAPRGPCECCQGQRREQHRQRHQHEEYGHGSPPKVRARNELVTTLSELSGIKIAAISGPITPVTASATPATL